MLKTPTSLYAVCFGRKTLLLPVKHFEQKKFQDDNFNGYHIIGGLRLPEIPPLPGPSRRSAPQRGCCLRLWSKGGVVPSKRAVFSSFSAASCCGHWRGPQPPTLFLDLYLCCGPRGPLLRDLGGDLYPEEEPEGLASSGITLRKQCSPLGECSQDFEIRQSQIQILTLFYDHVSSGNLYVSNFNFLLYKMQVVHLIP